VLSALADCTNNSYSCTNKDLEKIIFDYYLFYGITVIIVLYTPTKCELLRTLILTCVLWKKKIALPYVPEQTTRPALIPILHVRASCTKTGKIIIIHISLPQPVRQPSQILMEQQRKDRNVKRGINFGWEIRSRLVLSPPFARPADAFILYS
jgi:hypothetical protein